jgi:twinfilin-like protein
MDDFTQLASLVEDNTPAYLLVRSDASASEWLAISYVPDSAKVRDKVEYRFTNSMG